MIRSTRGAAFAFCLACALLPVGQVHAQSATTLSTQLISARKLEEAGVPLDGKWKYRFGDNPSWSLPPYDDAQWATISPGDPLPDSIVKRAREMEARGTPAILWFRQRLHPERSLIRKPLALDFSTRGAANVFVDARKILELGDLDRTGAKAAIKSPLLPTPFLFDSASSVVAIRYHLGSAMSIEHRVLDNALFTASLKPGAAIAEAAETRRLYGGLLLGIFGLFMGVGILHFVLYILMRKPISNLHYAAFAGQFALFPLTRYLANGTESLGMSVFLNQVGRVASGLSFLALLVFLYTTFCERIPRLAAIPVTLMLFWILSAVLPVTPFMDALVWITFLGFAFEGSRIIAVALMQHKDGAKTIAVGFYATFGLLTVLTLSHLHVLPPIPHAEVYFWLAWLGIVFAPSMQLVYGFANVSKGLEVKVAERTAALETQMSNERQRAQEQKALLDTMADLSGQLELSKLLQSVLERAVKLLGASGGELAIVDDAARELVVVANMHMSSNTVGYRLGLGDGAMGKAISQRSQLVIPDYSQWEGRSNLYEGVLSYAVVVSPLLSVDTPVGALAVWHDDIAKQFSESDLRLLNAFAQQATIAIQSARLFSATQEQREYFESVVRNSPVAIVTIGLDSNIEDANPAFEHLFGWQRDEIIGKNLDSLVTDEETLQDATAITHMAQNETVRHVARRRRKDGGWVEVEVLAVPVWVQGKRRGLVALYHDVTELTRAKREAEAADRAKSQFLANMSHELRTPLNAVIGYSEMLMEEAEDAGHEDYLPDLQKIHGSGRHLLGLINDILDLSKIEAGRMELYFETFDAAAMLEEVAMTIKPLIDKNGNSLVLTAGPELGLVRLDQVKVRQILFNLLSNASKFTDKGVISLVATREADRVIFKVTDTGIGMTTAQMEKLFQPFMQADASTTKKYGGTGLGLAITRHFCEMMGGSIDIHSEADRGTTFTVNLPADADEATERMQETISDVASVTGVSGTVLVIDDDPTAREMLSRMLTKEGYRVLAASSGEDGLRLAREDHPDVITLDVLMAGLDGWGVLTRLKGDAATADIPVVVVTVIDDRNLGYALGAADYLTKPVERERLSDALRRVRADQQAGPVLVVDDDPTTREMLRRILEKDGWAVVEAENGRVALDRMLEHMPSVVLLDLMMPEMDGFTFIDEIRQRGAVGIAPIVVLTAKTLTEQEKQRLQGAVSRVMHKGEQSSSELIGELRRVIQTNRKAAPAGGA